MDVKPPTTRIDRRSFLRGIAGTAAVLGLGCGAGGPEVGDGGEVLADGGAADPDAGTDLGATVDGAPGVDGGYDLAGTDAAFPVGFPFYNKPSWATEEVYHWGCPAADPGFPLPGAGIDYDSGPGMNDYRGRFSRSGAYHPISTLAAYNGGLGDPTAPFGPQNVWFTKYAKSMVGGVAPCSLYHWKYNGAVRAQYGRLYHVHVFKLHGTLPYDGLYELNSAGNKHGFIGHGYRLAAAGNQSIPFLVNGTGVQAALPDVVLGFNTQGYQTSYNPTTMGSPGITSRPNRGGYAAGSRIIKVGKWHTWETVCEGNTLGSVVGPDAMGYYTADGILRCYLDGVLVLEKTNYVYRHNGPPGTAAPFNNEPATQFAELYWNPTYGGGPDVKTRDDYIFHALETAWGDPNLVVG